MVTSRSHFYNDIFNKKFNIGDLLNHWNNKNRGLFLIVQQSSVSLNVNREKGQT